MMPIVDAALLMPPAEPALLMPGAERAPLMAASNAAVLFPAAEPVVELAAAPVVESVPAVAEPIAELAAEASPVAEAGPVAEAQPVKVSPSRMDLQLLRARPLLRLQCTVALLVPFVVYTVVMFAVSRMDRTYLIWLWIPAILAGSVTGYLLDRAHARSASR
jgi:hypothetical protein